VSFCRVLIDLNVGKPKRDVGGSTRDIYTFLGPNGCYGWHYRPAHTSKVCNYFDGCYGRV
jgi:hypothetical protein